MELLCFAFQAGSSIKDLLNSCQGKAPLHTISTCSSSDTKHQITARNSTDRCCSLILVNHCPHCHNRSVIISVMICLEKQPWGNQSENSQLASQNNFGGPSLDCSVLLRPSVSLIKTISPSVAAGCGWFVSIFWCLFFFPIDFFVHRSPQRPNESVCSRQRRRHPSLEGTNGADQSVQGQIHLACLHQGTVWTHGHTKHHARIGCEAHYEEQQQLYVRFFPPNVSIVLIPFQILLNRPKERSASSSRTSAQRRGWRGRSRRSDQDNFNTTTKNRCTQCHHRADLRPVRPAIRGHCSCPAAHSPPVIVCCCEVSRLSCCVSKTHFVDLFCCFYLFVWGQRDWICCWNYLWGCTYIKLPLFLC